MRRDCGSRWSWVRAAVLELDAAETLTIWDARRTTADGGDLFDKISVFALLLLSYTPLLTLDRDTAPDVGISEDIAHLYFTQLISGLVRLDLLPLRHLTL